MNDSVNERLQTAFLSFDQGMLENAKEAFMIEFSISACPMNLIQIVIREL
ncbi:MAG: hypothetical protein ACOX62_11230 [Christensenellales bacterium]|jgi:hypothetical protein